MDLCLFDKVTHIVFPRTRSRWERRSRYKDCTAKTKVDISIVLKGSQLNLKYKNYSVSPNYTADETKDIIKGEVPNVQPCIAVISMDSFRISLMKMYSGAIAETTCLQFNAGLSILYLCWTKYTLPNTSVQIVVPITLTSHAESCTAFYYIFMIFLIIPYTFLWNTILSIAYRAQTSGLFSIFQRSEKESFWYRSGCFHDEHDGPHNDHKVIHDPSYVTGRHVEVITAQDLGLYGMQG